MSSGNNNQEASSGRPLEFHNLQSFLQAVIRETAQEDAPFDSQVLPLDPQRRQWLEEVFQSMTVNVAQELAKSLQICHSAAISDPDSDVEDQVEALENLLSYVDSLDVAKDFEKIGGFLVIKPLLNSPHSALRWRAAELVAELVQNNPHCQQAAIKEGLFSELLLMLNNDDIHQVKVKALYALSCLIRENPEGQKRFADEDGFSVLLRAMQTDHEKLQTKACFLLTSVCSTQKDYKDLVCDMGFVEQLVFLVRQEHKPSHEHFLSALLALVTDHEDAKYECRRDELNLHGLLQERLNFIQEKEEFLEEANYCRQLIEILFSQEPYEDR